MTLAYSEDVLDSYYIPSLQADSSDLKLLNLKQCCGILWQMCRNCILFSSAMPQIHASNLLRLWALSGDSQGINWSVQILCHMQIYQSHLPEGGASYLCLQQENCNTSNCKIRKQQSRNSRGCVQCSVLPIASGIAKVCTIMSGHSTHKRQHSYQGGGNKDHHRGKSQPVPNAGLYRADMTHFISQALLSRFEGSIRLVSSAVLRLVAKTGCPSHGNEWWGCSSALQVLRYMTSGDLCMKRPSCFWWCSVLLLQRDCWGPAKRFPWSAPLQRLLKIPLLVQLHLMHCAPCMASWVLDFRLHVLSKSPQDGRFVILLPLSLNLLSCRLSINKEK